MEWGCVIVEMSITPYCDYLGVKTVYFIRILYFGVILEMFEWFLCQNNFNIYLKDLMGCDGVNVFNAKH